jgi:CheY-like chemotaxis protein
MTKNPKLLLAEDSPTQSLQIQALLTDAGYTVVAAKNGREALDMVRESRPDIVVTDMEMPEMDGLELVATLNKELPQLPVVLITARGSEEVAAKALRAGAASYVPKRELQTDLVPTLLRILAVVKAARAHDRLGSFVTWAEVEYELENDDTLVPFLVARLQDDLKHLQLCNDGELVQVATALDEALVNAIVHGNLEVSSKLREIDHGKPYALLIDERSKQQPYNGRRVIVRVKIDRERAMFVIRDQGPGFNPFEVPDPTDPANLEKVSGRGLLLINAFMDEVRHNDSGNEITMVKRKPSDSELI